MFYMIHQCLHCGSLFGLTRFNLCQFCWERFTQETQFSKNRKLQIEGEEFSIISLWLWPPNKCPALSSLLQALKHAKAPSIVFFQIAQQLWETTRVNIKNQPVDAVVSIPGAFQRKDHAWTLAKHLSKASGAPHIELLYQAKKNKIAQKRLSPNARAKNSTLICNPYKAKEMENCEIQRILVVDDIITTGATLKTAFRAIKSSFPKAQINGLVVADRPLAVALGL